jgi:uncharacterized protein YjbJ (UPF0337 family)
MSRGFVKLSKTAQPPRWRSGIVSRVHKQTFLPQETSMDWNRVEGSWKQVKGAVKANWGKLTDDDLDLINGRREQLEGKLQERYGLAADQIRKDVDTWYGAQTW